MRLGVAAFFGPLQNGVKKEVRGRDKIELSAVTFCAVATAIPL